ncbi:MAG: sensor histidine kinase [Desulfobacteraceae bacterium]|jgi:signal transduction histidine kinase|nr:sensor histidine kinase [Desulfobacteraceae bacterium]
MSILKKLKPGFLDHKDVSAGPYRHHFDFQQIWKRAILVTATVAIVPLIIWALSGYRLTMETIESELELRTSQLVSNSWRSVSLFLTERRSVMDFIAHDNSLETFQDPARLAGILENLNERFGGFLDLGVIDNSGKQISHTGSHQMEGLDFKKQHWFREVLSRGVYISKLVTGPLNEPHIDFAVKRELADGSYFVLHAVLKPEQLTESIAQIDVGARGDLFIINRDGVLQTPSRYYGPVFKKIPLAVPEYASKAQVFESINDKKDRIMIGYAHIPHTPYILMMIQEQSERIQPWYKTTWAFTAILVASILMILLVTLGVATHLVNQIHEADQERLDTLHQVEYASKMVSLGRLASGVAHEINNPLAIINEKAGHIRDIFTLTETYAKDPKLIGLVDSVISTVQRCAKVTKGLLNFARHLNLSIQAIDLKEIIDEVKSVLAKEAELRSITVGVTVSENIPTFESDRGKLEQVFFNLFNSALGAMNDGGHLEITATPRDEEYVSVAFTDNGRSIPESDLKHIFEPFYYSKTGHSGTGLGLAVTYALVQEIGGTISVQSRPGQETCFEVRIPLNRPTESSWPK